MANEAFDTIIFTQGDPAKIAEKFLWEMKKRWPGQIVYLTHPISEPVTEKVFNPGDVPALPEDDSFLDIERDFDMKDLWDWESSDVGDFRGEGPVQLFYRTFTKFDLDLIVKKETLSDTRFSTKEPYEAHYWGTITELTLVTPDNPETCSFSGTVLNYLKISVMSI